MNPDALNIINQPNRFAGAPTLRLVAWATLMTERGHRINQVRLGAMQRSLPALTVLTGLVPMPRRVAPPPRYQPPPYAPTDFDGAA
jgi:hypothetical protein